MALKSSGVAWRGAPCLRCTPSFPGWGGGVCRAGWEHPPPLPGSQTSALHRVTCLTQGVRGLGSPQALVVPEVALSSVTCADECGAEGQRRVSAWADP